jgi:hypothetical protein
MPGVGASQTRSDDSARAFHLHGHVVDLAYRAIPDAIVTLSPIGAGDAAIRTKTNPDGNFVLQGPPLGLPRRYELSIRHPSFKTSSQELDIWAEKIVNIQMILEVLPYVGVYPLHGSSYDPSPGAPSGLAAAQEPIETTVCDIVKRSAEFNGRVVRFRAAMSESSYSDNRRFNLSYSGCTMPAYFAIPEERPVEKFLTEEFRLSKRLAVDATLTGQVVVVPTNNHSDGDVFQIALHSVSDVAEGEKLKRVWVTGRFVDRNGTPIDSQELSLAAPRQNYYIPFNDLGGPTTDFDGRFRLPAIAPAQVTLYLGKYEFRKTLQTSAGQNSNLGDIVIKDADVEHRYHK